MRTILRFARRVAKMKQVEVAKAVGASIRFYQSLESGEREGRCSTWDRLEDLFGIPQRTLRENDPKQPAPHARKTHVQILTRKEGV